MAAVRQIGLLPSAFGCVQPIENWPIEFHPSYFVEGGIDMVMALYWRVRAFEVIVNVTHSGSPYSDTFTIRVGDEDGSTSGFSTETDLICEQKEWYFRLGYGITDFSIGLDSVYVDNSDNYFASFGVNDGFDSFRSGYRSDRDFGTNGNWILNFSGYSFTKPLYKIEASSGPASVVMNAVEYWPYDPGDGEGPIYDSATGAQLRSFP
jgi:hypothetical protein